MKLPNIIFVFSDQQRWDTCGCYGQSLDTTPNLDRMAREGVRFENAFTCQPVCGPARACLQTGKYAAEVGCHTNNIMLPTRERTIAHILSGQGYETGYVGKWHLASSGPAGGKDDFKRKPVPPERRGGYSDFWLASDVLEFTSHSYDGHMFDEKMNKREFPRGRYRADVLTDWAIEHITNRASVSGGSFGREKPFFMFISYIEPHHQNDHGHCEGPTGSKERFAGFEAPGDLAELQGNWREEYPDYLGCVNSLDRNLGRLRDSVDSIGVSGNTLFVYTSDHGSHFRTRNAEYKRSCHEGCIRVPMVLNGPGFKGGRVVDDLVSLIDLPPTLVAVAGAEPPDYMRGRSLCQLAEGDNAGWPEEVFLQISESHCGRAIRNRKWKYSVRAPDRGGDAACSDVYEEDFLYDLEEDPNELNNLVDSPAHESVRSEMRDLLVRRMTDAGEKAPEIKSFTGQGEAG